MRDGVAAGALGQPEGALGAALLLAAALAALAAPWLLPGDPLAIAGPPLLPPFEDAARPLGTDRLGRDVLAGVVHGARASLVVGVAVAAVALAAGASLGALAGYVGGALDELVMRVADAVQTVPAFLVALAVVSVAGPSLPALVGALALSAWTAPARVVRAEVLSLRNRPFVEASRLIGRGSFAVALAVVMPNALRPAIALAAVIVAGAILSESALAFLGLGDPNRASWGAMIAEGRAVLRTAPHVIVAPGLALLFTVLAVSLLGEAVARRLSGRSAG
jgi:peptide/nickel transport system permease protein